MKYTRKLEKHTMPSVGEDVEHKSENTLLGKFKWMPALWKTVWHCPLKLNILHATAIPLLDIEATEMRALVSLHL